MARRERMRRSFRRPGRRGVTFSPGTHEKEPGKPDSAYYHRVPTAFLRTYKRGQVQGVYSQPEGTPSDPEQLLNCPAQATPLRDSLQPSGIVIVQGGEQFGGSHRSRFDAHLQAVPRTRRCDIQDFEFDRFAAPISLQGVDNVYFRGEL